jgi:hypothetical protein
MAQKKPLPFCGSHNFGQILLSFSKFSLFAHHNFQNPAPCSWLCRTLIPSEDEKSRGTYPENQLELSHRESWSIFSGKNENIAESSTNTVEFRGFSSFSS